MGRERVARLLRDMGLVGLPARRVRHTTDSTHGRPVAPNVLERHFEADHPNQRWTTDITFIWTWEGWLYLAVVLDLYARRVVGWAVQPHLQTELALEALQLALGHACPPPVWCTIPIGAARVNATGRRNTSMMRCCSDRAGRPAMRSPGRPPATGRAAATVLEGDRAGAVE